MKPLYCVESEFANGKAGDHGIFDHAATEVHNTKLYPMNSTAKPKKTINDKT
jgi:hypothetical protein